jgi:hypothetical protein
VLTVVLRKPRHRKGYEVNRGALAGEGCFVRRSLVHAAVIISVGVLVAPALAERGPNIKVKFSSNATKATINSSDRVSSYRVRLCSGPQRIRHVKQPKTSGHAASVKEKSGRTKPRKSKRRVYRLTIGPFRSPIVRVTVKSGRTVRTLVSRVNCQPEPVIPEAPSALLLPLSILATLGFVGAVTWHRRRQVSTARDGHARHA